MNYSLEEVLKTLRDYEFYELAAAETPKSCVP